MNNQADIIAAKLRGRRLHIKGLPTIDVYIYDVIVYTNGRVAIKLQGDDNTIVGDKWQSVSDFNSSVGIELDFYEG